MAVKRVKTSVFMNGRCQAVRIPKEFRFPDGAQIEISQDDSTGDLRLRNINDDWSRVLALVAQGGIDEDFLADREAVDHD